MLADWFITRKFYQLLWL